jgi:hypothetical protein
MHMIVELGLATLLVLTTVAMHGFGLLVLAQMVRHIEPPSQRGRFTLVSLRGSLLAMAIVLGLFVTHGLEIWLYAKVFHRIGAIHDLREAVYFSTSSYAAIGYGDDIIAEKWKLLGAIEGVNGVILLGWSVAFFVTAMSRLLPPTHHKERSSR